MKAIFDVPAPAKLNLFLHIIGRRADGYHLLQSAFVLIDWCDTLHFERRTDGQISRTDLGELELPPDDLSVRAARALQQATGCRAGVHISLDKRLPAQAGLGGGSSDAASTLLALNRLWRLGLDRTALQAIGLTLGADVPFFLGDGAAWVEGVGERMQPLVLPPARFVVLKPPCGLATPAIFSDPLLKRDTNAATIAGFAADPFGFGRNDLQPVAERMCPQVSEAIAWLASQGLAARMTGSGSAVFACLGTPDAEVPAGLASVHPGNGCIMQVCGSLDVHPLKGWASKNV